MTTLTISNEEMNDIMKMVQFFKESGLLKKNVLVKFLFWRLFLFYVVDIFKLYEWVVTLKDNKCVTITYAFEKKIYQKS